MIVSAKPWHAVVAALAQHKRRCLPLQLVKRARQLLPATRILNLYGSTEVSADATCYDVATTSGQHDAEQVSADVGTLIAVRHSSICALGQPIRGAKVCILHHPREDSTDSRAKIEPGEMGAVQEVGVIGEIAISETSCHGYLERPG